MRTFPGLMVLAVVGALLWGASPARAQLFGRGPAGVQVSVGAVPGVGMHAVYLQPRTVLTVEAALYADVQAPFSEAGERRFQAAGAVGGALRVLRLARIVAGLGPPGDLDVGLRTGPGLGFQAEETRAEKNRRFRLLLDPFVRYVRSAAGVRLFGELGLARPRLRVGVGFSL